MLRPRAALAAARRYPLPALALLGLACGLAAYAAGAGTASQIILLATLVAGGAPVVFGTLRGMLRGHFAADIVASLAIVGALSWLQIHCIALPAHQGDHQGP